MQRITVVAVLALHFSTIRFRGVCKSSELTPACNTTLTLHCGNPHADSDISECNRKISPSPDCVQVGHAYHEDLAERQEMQ
jgi:hypothetical protein